jgi:TonB family protein
MKMRLFSAPIKYAAYATLITIVIAGTSGKILAQETKPGSSSAGQLNNGSAALSQAQIDKIISAFTAKETQFRRALNEYAFKRDALIQVIGMGGQVTGEYHRVSDFTFDDQGTRFEKINFFPMPTFAGVTAEDLEDLGGVNPFALEAAKLSEYNFKYVGKERIDELDLYVFDVSPKVAPKKTFPRFFTGRIWVDDRDLQIVKSKGKAIPETKNNKFPVVETYREQIDGKYWFPTYAYADDDLIYDNGTDMRIRMRVKYSDYRVGHGKVTITEIGEAPTESTKPQSPAKPQSQPSSSPTPQVQPQTAGESEENHPIEGGILNGKAIELPLPKYPTEARKAHAAGEVQIRVLIDETGKVVSAEVVFGPDVFREVSVEAAKRARFTPTLLAGVPVKVNGIIIYRFVAQ